MTNFMNMLKDESGASAAEYALILAIVGSVIALAAVTLGNNIGRAMDGAGSKICSDPDDKGGATALCTADAAVK
jgi:pilus assembly protein Flp/PilA